MRSFEISIHSFQQLKAFVALAMVQPFDVLVGNDRQQVNGKNYIGMSSLDFHRPLLVQVRCDESSYRRFQQQALQLFAS